MNTLDAVLAVPVGLVVLYVLFIWVFYPVKFLTVDLYRHIKYTQKGLCPKCHKPLEARAVPADQLYGPSTIIKTACSCGAKPFPIGNRRFGDWAGF